MDKEETQLTVQVTPNARKTEVTHWDGAVLKIKLHALPEKGKANKELIEFLSKFFKIPKTSITLIRGETSRNKTLKVPLSPQALSQAIKDQLP